MKDIFSIAIQVIFISAGFGLAFWLLYYAVKSPKKDHNTHLTISATKGKSIG